MRKSFIMLRSIRHETSYEVDIFWHIFVTFVFFSTMTQTSILLGIYIRDHRSKSKLFTKQTAYYHKFLIYMPTYWPTTVKSTC